MPRPRSKQLVHLEVTGLAPFPPAMEEWERALVEPVLSRLFAAPTQETTDKRGGRDGEDAR